MSIHCPTCLAENPDQNLNCFACGAPLVLDQSNYHLSSGTILTSSKCQYKIEKTLGIGGFGITYKGIDLSTSQAVAIKENWPENASRQGEIIIWPSSISPQDRKAQIQKVLKEAENISTCHQPQIHPYIVQVYDWFTANNTAYIIMEFLSGKSLYNLLKENGKFSDSQIKKYFYQISQALKAIHSKNLLHRDIKPDNIILVEAEDRAVLIDFGNSREFIANKTQRMTQILTPGYAPLEQYAQATKRSPTIDIYALCASMYELLTEQLPSPATERVNANPDTLISPRQLNPNISPILEKVILTGMAIKADDRYQMIDDLIDSLAGNPPGLTRARQLVKEQKINEAVQSYQYCLKHVEQEEATVELALVLLYVDEQEAESMAKKAIKIKPDDGRGYGVLGLIYCHQLEWTEALNYLQKAVNLSPNESWMQANLAWVLGELGQWEKAQKAANYAYQLNPQCYFSLGLQAWIAINQQEWKSAIRYSRKAISQLKSPNNNQVLLNWIYPCLIIALPHAVITQQAPDIERALQEFITQVPDQGFPWGYKGWQQARQGLWSEAVTYFEQGSKKKQFPFWLLLNLGITLEHLQMIGEAIQIYHIYLQDSSPHPFVLYRLGTLYGKLKKWQQARAYLEEAIRLDSEFPQVYHNLGWVLLNLRNKSGEIENSHEILLIYRRAKELYRQQSQSSLIQSLINIFKVAGIEL